MYGGGIDHQIRLLYVVRALSYVYLDTLCFQSVRESRLLHIRAAYLKARVYQYLGKSGHADAAYTYEMNPDGCIKFKLVHNFFLK